MAQDREVVTPRRGAFHGLYATGGTPCATPESDHHDTSPACPHCFCRCACRTGHGLRRGSWRPLLHATAHRLRCMSSPPISTAARLRCMATRWPHRPAILDAGTTTAMTGANASVPSVNAKPNTSAKPSVSGKRGASARPARPGRPTANKTRAGTVSVTRHGTRPAVNRPSGIMPTAPNATTIAASVATARTDPIARTSPVGEPTPHAARAVENVPAF